MKYTIEIMNGTAKIVAENGETRTIGSGFSDNAKPLVASVVKQMLPSWQYVDSMRIGGLSNGEQTVME